MWLQQQYAQGMMYNPYQQYVGGNAPGGEDGGAEDGGGVGSMMRGGNFQPKKGSLLNNPYSQQPGGAAFYYT